MPYLITEITARGVVKLTLNRADKHNAFNEDFIAEMTQTLDDISHHTDARLMLLAASGKSFSAGADLDWMKRMASHSKEDNLRDANALAGLLHKLNTLPIATIAKVQGAAMGGGCGLVSCCDIAIATNAASFAFSEAKIGLVPATISPYIIESIGIKNARRYFQTAERFNARRAMEMGLVSEVIHSEHIDEHIDTLITRILGNSHAAVKAAKQLVAAIAGQPVTAELMAYSSQIIADIRASAEGKEGLDAFLEKRKPNWLE